MKKSLFTYVLGIFMITIVGCSTDEKFNGSPIDDQTIVTLMGAITTPVENALTDQKVEFTASLPEGKTFSDTVTVEVTTLRTDGGRVRGYYDILPGQTSVTDEIDAVGGLVFDTTFELSMTAIRLKTTEPGTHYLMTSNKVVINTGSSSIPDVESDRLQVRIVWENPSPSNRFKLWIDKPDGSTTDILGNNFNNALLHVIRNNATGNENGSQSFAEGDYIFKLAPQAQLLPEEDKKYRIILVFPTGDVKVFNGIYENLTLDSPKKHVLKITKTGSGGNASYSAVQL